MHKIHIDIKRNFIPKEKLKLGTYTLPSQLI